MSNNEDTDDHNASAGQDGNVLKEVSIQPEPEEIFPALPNRENPRIHRASLSGRKLGGRPALSAATSYQSLSRQISNLRLDHFESNYGDVSQPAQDPAIVLAQVVRWLQEEKAKLFSKRHEQRAGVHEDHANEAGSRAQDARESQSQVPDQSLALDKLEAILGLHISENKNVAAGSEGIGHTPFSVLRRSSIARRLKPNAMTISSELDQDDELNVPSIEASLDNSKTVVYASGLAETDAEVIATERDRENWVRFKCEIVRLTHTLRLRRWKRVPIEGGGDISVERLSGALTNAVYVVSPPKRRQESSGSDGQLRSASFVKDPPKLLLRIYGPQADHLIDREAELSILRRLAKKNIGPRLLGTFANGRFEEFLHARTLTKDDLRNPETSKQIAKRMRELHDGIELLEEERERGPFVWMNWDKWLGRCEKIVTWLDKQILSGGGPQGPGSERPWMTRGLICGVEWHVFRRAVDRYRQFIIAAHGGKQGIKQQLVFAHNDTQYGNVLRLQPSGESPLLHPANEHKQLVVIDFEYASANLPGFDIVNHFTEWCYDYHHPEHSWSVNTAAYPTPEEQRRFVKSYVEHRPSFGTEDPAMSRPRRPSGTSRTNSVSAFMLDSRAPPDSASTYATEEKARDEATDRRIETLIEDARLWRGMCSAQWVAWGVVQAKIPKLDHATSSRHRAAGKLMGKFKARLKPQSDPLGEEVLQKQRESKMDRPEGREIEEANREGDDDQGSEHVGFDYLAYAQDRALFFWGDCLQLGLISADELPEELIRKVKKVAY